MCGDIVGHKDTVITVFEVRFLDSAAENWAGSSFQEVVAFFHTSTLVQAFLRSKFINTRHTAGHESKSEAMVVAICVQYL